METDFAESFILRPLEANFLESTNLIVKQDPFAVISIGEHQFKTAIDRKGGLHPHWANRFSLSGLEGVTVSIKIYDKGMILPDHLLGETEFPLSNIMFGNELQEQRLDLFLNEKKVGDILLQFSPAGSEPSDAVIDVNDSKLSTNNSAEDRSSNKSFIEKVVEEVDIIGDKIGAFEKKIEESLGLVANEDSPEIQAAAMMAECQEERKEHADFPEVPVQLTKKKSFLEKGKEVFSELTSKVQSVFTHSDNPPVPADNNIVLSQPHEPSILDKSKEIIHDIGEKVQGAFSWGSKTAQHPPNKDRVLDQPLSPDSPLRKPAGHGILEAGREKLTDLAHKLQHAMDKEISDDIDALEVGGAIQGIEDLDMGGNVSTDSEEEEEREIDNDLDERNENLFSNSFDNKDLKNDVIEKGPVVSNDQDYIEQSILQQKQELTSEKNQETFNKNSGAEGVLDKDVDQGILDKGSRLNEEVRNVH